MRTLVVITEPFPDLRASRPIPISPSGRPPATAYAALTEEKYLPTGVSAVPLGPLDTIESALARAGFRRVAGSIPVKRKVVGTVIAPLPEPKGFFARVKSLFGG